MFFKNSLISIRISVFTSVHRHRTCGWFTFYYIQQTEKYFKINLIYIIRQHLKGCPDIRNLPLLCNCATTVTWVFYCSVHRNSNFACWVFIINHKNILYIFCCQISQYFFHSQNHHVYCSNCLRVSGQVT